MAEGLNERPAPLRLKPEDDSAADAGMHLPIVGGEAERQADDQHSHPHTGKFRLATAVLVGLAVGAIVVAVAVGVNGRTTPPVAPKWSQWKPTDGGLTGAREIADFLAPFYRATPADQLAVVTVVNLESAAALAAQQQAAANGTTTTPSSNNLEVAVRPSSTSSQVTLLTGNTIAYNLCGIGGNNCAIGVGKPSVDRLLLLRREALELALYTFKYIGGTQNVVAILPPVHTATTTTTGASSATSSAKQPAKASGKKPAKGAGKTPAKGSAKKPATATVKSAGKPAAKTTTTSQAVDIAVLFERQEVAPLLAHPLAASLPEQVPPTVAEMPSAPEAELVSEVTARGLFSEQLQQAQDGSNLIVLDPLPPQ